MITDAIEAAVLYWFIPAAMAGVAFAVVMVATAFRCIDGEAGAVEAKPFRGVISPFPSSPPPGPSGVSPRPAPTSIPSGGQDGLG